MVFEKNLPLVFACNEQIMIIVLAWYSLREKSPYSVFFGRYFPAFTLNTETYSVNLRILLERKNTGQKNLKCGHFFLSNFPVGANPVSGEIIVLKL